MPTKQFTCALAIVCFLAGCEFSQKPVTQPATGQTGGAGDSRVADSRTPSPVKEREKTTAPTEQRDSPNDTSPERRPDSTADLIQTASVTPKYRVLEVQPDGSREVVVNWTQQVPVTVSYEEQVDGRGVEVRTKILYETVTMESAVTVPAGVDLDEFVTEWLKQQSSDSRAVLLRTFNSGANVTRVTHNHRFAVPVDEIYLEGNEERVRTTTQRESVTVDIDLLIAAGRDTSLVVTNFYNNAEEIFFLLERAEFLLDLNRANEAIELLDKADSLSAPTSFSTLIRHLAALLNKDVRGACRILEEHTQAFPDDPAGASSLAWILATCPDDSIRDGVRALRLAEQACAQVDFQDPNYLSNLAAAYAEIRDFNTAIKYIDEALQYVDANPKSDETNAFLISELNREKQSYLEERPLRESATSVAPETAKIRELMKEIDRLKNEKLGWQSASPDAQRFWHELELANRLTLQAVLEVCLELANRGNSIEQLHKAALEIPGADMPTLLRSLENPTP